MIDLSEILIEKEVLDAEEVIHILKYGTLPEPSEPPPEETPAEETSVEETPDVDEENLTPIDPNEEDSPDEGSGGIVLS